MDSQWTGWNESLEVNKALFHFNSKMHAALKGVGLRGLDSAVGLMEFCCTLAELARDLDVTTIKAWESQKHILVLEDLLGAAVREDPDLANPSTEFLAEVRERLQSVNWVARVEPGDSGEVALRHHAFIKDLDGIYAVLAVVLFKSANRKLVGQCSYPPCSRYFIVNNDDPGRPTDYCNPAHRDLDATPRKRRQRAERELSRFPNKEAVRAAVMAAMREHPEVTGTKQLAAYAEERLRLARKHK